MDILGYNTGHDGSAVRLRNGDLDFFYEAEKDGFPRYSPATVSLLLNSIRDSQAIPDVIAVGGWSKGHSFQPLEAGYFGIDRSSLITLSIPVFGRSVKYFSSSHERSHIFCSYGMSPFPQGMSCYMLVWEGLLGNFYEIDPTVNIRRLATVVDNPGAKYAALYALADVLAPSTSATEIGMEYAGKLMALAGWGRDEPLTEEESELTDILLDGEVVTSEHTLNKEALSKFSFHNMGLNAQFLRNFARKFSNILFDRFYAIARERLTKRYPLLIGGGCGLNCDWNVKWRDCGLFADVFVPPCTNDSGSALGVAIDAMHHHSGQAKITWKVDAGAKFLMNEYNCSRITAKPFDPHEVAAFLADGKVIGWVQGRYEIGPRALGHRSIFASPFSGDMRQRLNTIKQREDYRPIAPICIEGDVGEHFEWRGSSPYMLYFQRVLDERLKAITHQDGTARVQTISDQDDERTLGLLQAFKRLTGVSVLCNTSLNAKGYGFINRMSELVAFARQRGLDGFVVEGTFYDIG